MVKLLAVYLISTLSFGQNYAKFGQATQVDEPGSTTSNKSISKPDEVDRPAPKECSAKDQVSMPQQDLQALMIYKGKSISANSSLGGDYLNVELDSPIIGNCSSMLQPKLTYSNKHSKYLYEVKIRKLCDDSECEYEVSSLEDGEKKVSAKKYSPTLAGFYKCMEENVGLNEEKTAWDKSKIVKKDLSKASVSSPVTSNLIMVSRGPVGMQNSGAKNLIDNNECDYFENLNDSEFKHYSSDDLEKMNLEKAAQALCRTGDYLDIEAGLSNFASNGDLYQSMINVRNQLLLDEIKSERAHLQELKSSKDLSSLNAAAVTRYKKLSEDFYKLIIDKNISTENHSVDDQNNKDLLVNMRAQYQLAYDSGSYDLADEWAIKIAQKVDELSKYMVSPYFDVSDYQAMSDLALKPEIENSEWKEATKNVHKSIMTLKLLCEAYVVNNKNSGKVSKRCEENKTSNANFKKKSQLTMIEAVAKRTDQYNEKAMDSYDEKAVLVKNPTAYKSLKYVKLLNECKQHKATSEQYAKVVSAQMPSITQSCQQKSQNNQQALQQCIEQYKSQITGDATSFKLKLDNCESMNDHYVAQQKKWEGLEAQRDDYIGFSDAEKKKRKAKVDEKVKAEKFEYTYKYKGITQSQSSSQNQVYNQNSSMSTNPYVQGNMNSSINYNTNSYSNPYSTNNYSMFQGNTGYSSNPYTSYMNNGYSNNYYQNSSNYYGASTGLNFNYGLNGSYGQQNYSNPYTSYMNNTGSYTQNNNGFVFGNTGTTNTGFYTNPGTSTTQSGGFQFDFN